MSTKQVVITCVAVLMITLFFSAKLNGKRLDQKAQALENCTYDVSGLRQYITINVVKQDKINEDFKHCISTVATNGEDKDDLIRECRITAYELNGGLSPDAVEIGLGPDYTEVQNNVLKCRSEGK